MQIGRGQGEIPPGANFFAARGARRSVGFKRRPFFRRAIDENSLAIVASGVHRGYLASAVLLRGASSIPRRFFLAWNRVFFEAVSLISRIVAISEWRKPSTS